ncbi:MAG: type IV pilus biogenesis/stability protein PilW [SAR86 cluster bacterium]|uniref:Type IV pilus biogenesis/stability protein PilW n=1 Tax=SAR86 cluster bacterium TaxID=2030880 RepID=A0A2A5AVB2_9GAMM|nr:MAG: type IV pilus biogenesis/stability protein PilW [SAR86 cluster bacterium]
MLIRKSISRALAIIAVGFLTSCITTTTGGFLTDVSDERAISDYVQLALAYYDAGDMIGARRHVGNVMAIDDNNSEIHMVLALIFQREGDIDLADENFRRAIRLNGENSRARNNYAVMLFSQERFPEAITQLEQVVNNTDYEGRAVAFESLGRTALRVNRISDAQRAFERALQLNSNLYIASLELALLHFGQQDFASARAVFQSYLTTAQFNDIPHSPRALLAGIQIEGHFNNQKIVDDFTLILRTLFQSSPEYQAYQRLDDAL